MSKKLFGKFFIILLVMGLLFVAVTPKQAQAQTPSVWDGVYPAARPTGMADPVAGVQLVNTAEEFAWLASQPNMFTSGVTTVKLMVDINLDSKPWTPSNALGGGLANTFDGNGHTISNLTVNVVNTTDDIVHAAMFLQSSYDMPLIKQLIVDGANVSVTAGNLKQGYAGVVASGVDWHGSFQNVTVKNASVTGTKYVGGIASYNSLDWINCTVTNVTLNVIEHFKPDGTSRDLPHVGALVGLDNAGQVYGNTVSNLTIIVTPPSGQPDRTDRIGALIGTAQPEVLVGANNVSGVTLNGAPYTKLIGLDQRTYKVVNATQMLGYTTIQAAITAAANGDTIMVFAGTYVVNSVILIDKAITLQGQPGAKIQVSGTGDRIDIAAAATLTGFEIEKTDKTGEQNIIRIRWSNVTVSNNHIHGQYALGDGDVARAMVINAGEFTGISITGNDIHNLRQPAYISGTHTGTISNNFVHETKGWVVEGGNLTFTGNTWANNIGDIAILGPSGTYPGVPAGFYTDIVAMSAANNGAVIEDQRMTPALLSVVYVDDSAAAGGNGTEAAPYQTIQAGIGRVISGGTVHVAAGTYNEVGQIVIDKNLTLVGAGEASTIIKPTANTGSSGDAGAFFLVNNDVTFNISQVTIDGQGFDIRQALRFNGSGVVDHVTIKNIVYPGYMGWGIAEGASNTNPRSLTVSNSTFMNFGRVGIQTDEGSAASVATITGNTITCNGTGDHLDYGIYVEGGSEATISGNTISNCGGTVDIWGSAAIAVSSYFAPGTQATITNNIISNSSTGIAVGYGDTDTSVVVATGNQLLNNVYAITTSGPAVDGAPNWWGTAVGPQPSMYDGDVDVSSWCTDPGCLNIAYAAQVAIAPVTPVVCGNTLTSTINVNVTGVPATSPMQGYQFRLHFDNTKTSIVIPETAVVNGGFIEDGGYLVTRWLNADGSASTTPTGILEVGYTQYLGSTSTGSGTLASITLTHLGVPGDIALSITDVVLSTADGYVIPSEASATPVTLTLSPAVLNITKVPNVGYCDLASAVLAADPNDVLQLQADITIPTTVTVNKAITLDLNGKVASYTPPTGGGYALIVSGSGALTVDDTGTNGAIRAIGWEGRGINVKEGGSLVVDGGAIQGEYASVYVRANSSMVLNDGLIGGVFGDAEYSGIIVLGNGTTDSAILEVKGGEIVSYDFAISGNGTLNATTLEPLYGGTKIAITAGTITSTGALGEAIYHPQAGTLDISGGTITGHQGVEMRSGTLNLTGGTIHAIGNYVANADLDLRNGYSTDTGDAIFVGTSDGSYAGNVVVNISGTTAVITSDHGFALREAVKAGETTNTDLINVTGGTFYGGIDAGEAGAVVKFDTVAPAILKLTGGLYNTDPADPIVYVYVPYGTIPEGSMYRIVGISLNVHDFYYANYDTGHGILRGVSTDFFANNFLFSDATSVEVRLYSGVEGAYVLQQTNVLNLPTTAAGVLTSSFDYFGTYVSNSWNNDDTGFDPTAVPTRVEVTVVLPGGTLEGFLNGPTGERTDILPGVSGLVTLQGILAPRAGVGITLTPVSGITRTTSSNEMTGINYWFTGVETLTYTFTTSQARYLNVTTASSKIFLVDRDLNLTDLRLYGGDVDQNNEIQVNDASLVGQNWGSTTDPEANINYDGIVNIQDLALVGGNFGMTSATAYNWWSPLP